MTRLFGTDGVRGLANETLTASLALKLGAAAATVVCERCGPMPETVFRPAVGHIA